LSPPSKYGSVGYVPPSRRSRALNICLISPHALALEEFRRALSSRDFQVHTLTLKSPLTLEIGRLPRAAIYVVDAPAAWPAPTAAVTAIQDRHPSARLVVVAGKLAESTAFLLLRLGVKGLLRYVEVPKKLPVALRTVAAGGYWVPRTQLSRFVDRILRRAQGRPVPAGPGALSRREREVLAALLDNLSNKEIASRLNISERTVKFHVSNVLSKFGVQRRADLIVLSFQGGLPAR
jgi:DNA-binding NarL/FixJ family response regulator